MEHKNYVILFIYIILTCFLSEKLCGCETWSLALRNDNIWRASENRVPRRMYWHMTEEIGDLRKLHEEPHYLLTAVNLGYQIKEDNLRNAYKVKGRDHSWVLGVESRKILKKGKGARGRGSEDVVCSCLASYNTHFEAVHTAAANTLINLCFHKRQDVL